MSERLVKTPAPNRDELFERAKVPLHEQPTPEILQGRKDDQGKVRWDLLPPDALEEIAKVLTFGANKYEDRNWEKGMKWGRCFRALIGHCWSWWRGHPADEETGLSHMAHAGCCVLFLLSYELRKIGHDDRHKI